MLKDATPEELLHAVHVVAAGDVLLAPALTTRHVERVLPALIAACLLGLLLPTRRDGAADWQPH